VVREENAAFSKRLCGKLTVACSYTFEPFSGSIMIAFVRPAIVSALRCVHFVNPEVKPMEHNCLLLSPAGVSLSYTERPMSDGSCLRSMWSPLSVTLVHTTILHNFSQRCTRCDRQAERGLVEVHRGFYSPTGSLGDEQFVPTRHARAESRMLGIRLGFVLASTLYEALVVVETDCSRCH
jgi:hypothetical protein